MSRIQISENKRGLLRDGKPFLWLADTCWSGFTNATDEEWEEYLCHREKQGVNVLQINALPQWDRCKVRNTLFPFPTNTDGSFDFSSFNEAYFQRAAAMCKKVVDHGMVPAIVVMWCNFVPGAWVTNFEPRFVMPEEYVAPVVKKITETFAAFDPVYIISGDPDWNEQTVPRYELVTKLVEMYAPDALKCYHMGGFISELPESLASHADFYIYQTGHDPKRQDEVAAIAEAFYRRTPVKPVINSEPCYEQMGYGPAGFGRFRRDAVRAAFWNSILSGASAGITYGANGVWNWQSDRMEDPSAAEDVFIRGFRATEAMKLPGAEDYAFGIQLLEQLGLYTLTPSQDILTEHQKEIRAARCGDTTLLYLPANTLLNLNGYFCDSARVYDLETGATAEIPVKFENGLSKIGLHPFYADALVILKDAE